MKPMEPPTCRLCEKKHWAREGCAINPLQNPPSRLGILHTASKAKEPGAAAKKARRAAGRRPKPHVTAKAPRRGKR